MAFLAMSAPGNFRGGRIRKVRGRLVRGQDFQESCVQTLRHSMPSSIHIEVLAQLHFCTFLRRVPSLASNVSFFKPRFLTSKIPILLAETAKARYAKQLL